MAPRARARPHNPNLPQCPHCNRQITMRCPGDLTAHLAAAHGLYEPGDPMARTTSRSHLNRHCREALITQLKQNYAEGNELKQDIDNAEYELYTREDALLPGAACVQHQTVGTHVRYVVNDADFVGVTRDDLMERLIKLREELWGAGATLEADLQRVKILLGPDE